MKISDNISDRMLNHTPNVFILEQCPSTTRNSYIDNRL